MANKRSNSRKITKVPLALFVLGIIALAIPLTVIFSQQQTSFQQFAAKNKKKNSKNNNNKKNNKKEESGENTHRWIPGGQTITVEDYSNPEIWNNYVELKTAQWSNLLQGGATLTYARKEFMDCEYVLIIKTAWQLRPNIIVCSTSKDESSYGSTIWSLSPTSGALRASLVQLVDKKAGNKRNKVNTVCHELGHAVGIRHNNSSKSCVNSDEKLQNPGSWDANTLKKSYGGTVTDPELERSLNLEQAN